MRFGWKTAASLAVLIGMASVAQAQTITCTTEPVRVWPPNNKMKETPVTVVGNGFEENEEVTLNIQVWANDGAGPGDADSANGSTLIVTADSNGDFTAVFEVSVRAKRSGQAKPNGRGYLSYVSATGNMGSFADDTTYSYVPHDQRDKKDPPEEQSGDQAAKEAADQLLAYMRDQAKPEEEQEGVPPPSGYAPIYP